MVGSSWDKALEQIPANLTPRLVPGDGVADFFLVVYEELDSQALRITVFLDQDWRDLVDDQLFINSAELGPSFRVVPNIAISAGRREWPRAGLRNAVRPWTSVRRSMGCTCSS